MRISVDKNTINKDLLFMTTLYGTGTTIVDETELFYIFEYSNPNIPALIEEHADMFPEFSVTVFSQYVANMQTETTKQISALVDGVAKMHGYDDMKSVRSYTGFDNPFRDECLALATWGASCWAKAEEIRAEYEAGELDSVSVEYVMSQMPEYEGDE